MVVDLLKVDAAKVNTAATFSDLGADSLDMVELLMSIEDTFEPFGGLKIADEDANINTVGEAVDRIDGYIKTYLNQGAAS
ncbi:MAG TPA: acyl carrier protein [Chloroflexia bacterium]|nr:acyl carrier protein [Chloroflexia bacterium]